MQRALIFFLMFVFFSPVEAQNEKLTLHIENVLFRDFVDHLEKETFCKIYYADDWVDSLFINVDSSGEDLEQILYKALANSGFAFIITGNNKIVLYREYTIKTNFQEEYERYLAENMAETDPVVYVAPLIMVEDEKYISDEFRLFNIGNPSEMNRKGRVVLSGTIKDAATGLPVVGAIIYVNRIRIGTVSDIDGFYSLALPRGKYLVEYRTIGMETARRNLNINSEGEFNIEMYEKLNQLEEVTVSAHRDNNVQSLLMGTEKISLKMLKQIPMGIGEPDVIKSSLLLPGVQSVGEAAAGYNIRGGSTDQNLMLLNGAPILNPSHFFGFFSTFNSDVIGDITLYKSGIPANFGGRISSVMDIKLKEGNKETFKASGGISPVTGRVMIEGPLNDRVSYIFSARTTYSDWMLKQLADQRLQESSASFYDIQGMTNIAINKNNNISLSGYYSNDKFDYYNQSAFDYSNLATTLQWHHTFKPNLFAEFSAIMSNYHYQVDNMEDSMNMTSMFYKLDQYISRADFTYFPAEGHKVNFGLNATFYKLAPGEQLSLNDFSFIIPKKLEEERALESSLYVGDEYAFSPSIIVSGGLRYNMYFSFGPDAEFIYTENLPLSPESIQDTILYSKRQIKTFYPNLEFRISSRFLVGSGFSFKAGIQRMYQYVYMVSNTTALTPTDIWKLSDNYIKPQRSDQFSLGLYKNFKRNTIETSVETYYKKLNNIIDYKGGAQLLMNEYLETVILNGTGRAYGIELMLKKTSGSLSGWISYTYSRIFHKFDGESTEEKINNGNYFPATYDKPHDLKLVVNTKLSRRLNVTTNFVYNTGRPISYPVGYFSFSNASQLFYSDRNEFRIPDYIRLDLAATLNGNLKARKLIHSSFTLSVYNVLGRRNPYSIFFKLEEGEVKGYKMSIFGQPIVTLAYNFKFLGNASDDF